MKNVADFYPLVLAASDIATDEHESVVHEAIRASTVAFMRETEIARDEMYIRAQCGVDEYPLDMPDCHVLVGVRDVWTGGKASIGRLVVRATPDSWEFTPAPPRRKN